MFAWGYLRGISKNGKIPPVPDAVMMLSALEHVQTIDDSVYDPGDFEQCTRYYYHTWHGMVSLRKIREMLPEWAARGKPQIS
jgi:hypothetical protein